MRRGFGRINESRITQSRSLQLLRSSNDEPQVRGAGRPQQKGVDAARRSCESIAVACPLALSGTSARQPVDAEVNHVEAVGIGSDRSVHRRGRLLERTQETPDPDAHGTWK